MFMRYYSKRFQYIDQTIVLSIHNILMKAFSGLYADINTLTDKKDKIDVIRSCVEQKFLKYKNDQQTNQSYLQITVSSDLDSIIKLQKEQEVYLATLEDISLYEYQLSVLL